MTSESRGNARLVRILEGRPASFKLRQLEHAAKAMTSPILVKTNCESGTYEERVVNVCKNGVLGDNVIDLSQFDDVCFLQSLHRKVFARLAIFCQKNSTERACVSEIFVNKHHELVICHTRYPIASYIHSQRDIKPINGSISLQQLLTHDRGSEASKITTRG
jgi:hypothetical protein